MSSGIQESKFKFVGIDGDAVFSREDTALFFSLSRQQTQLLLQLLPSMHWRTRWNPSYPQSIIDEFVSALELALMTPIDVNQPIGGYSVATLPIGSIFHSLSPVVPVNCLPLWNTAYPNTPTHPDFPVVSGSNVHVVRASDYPELYDACPDFQQMMNLGSGLEAVVNLSGFNARVLMIKNSYEQALDGWDGNLSVRSVASGQRFIGAEIHQLDIDEMPSHDHELQFNINATVLGNQKVGIVSNGTAFQNANAITNTGGGQAHNNIQPSAVTYAFVIAKPANNLFDGVVTDENVCDYVDSCLDIVTDDPQAIGYDETNNPSIDTLDCVWGGLNRLINWLNDDLNNYMDIIDELGDIASAVPGFSILGSIVQFVGVFSAALTSVVRTGNNTVFRDDLKCFFFCRIQQRGEPYQLLPEDIEAYRAYAWERANTGACGDLPIFAELCPLGILDLLDLPTDAAHLAFYYMFTIYPYVEYIKRFALGFSDECNDDWQILCGCVDSYEVNIDSEVPSYNNTGFILLEGYTYRFIVAGQYQRGSSNQSLNDAQYSTDDRWNTVKPWGNSNGLFFNGSKLPEQPYSSEHIYIWDIVGDGSEASFKIQDTAYTDNSGVLNVSMIRIS